MSDMSNLTAVILCGGKGTRLSPIIADRPKALAKINNVPFIFYLLEQLEESGINKVVLCTGYLGNLIVDAVGLKYKQLDVMYSEEQSALGTGGALRNCIGYVLTDYAIVMNGDSYTDFDIQHLFAWHQEKKAVVSLVAVKVPEVERYGSIGINSHQQITEFFEKKKEVEFSSGLVNAGIYMMDRNEIGKLPGNKSFSFEQEYLPSIVGRNLFGFQSNGRFIDIGTPASFHSAASFFESHKIPVFGSSN